MVKQYRLEFWTDSFHEGNWAAEQLANDWRIIEKIYLFGFVPQITYSLSDEMELIVTIYGSYNSWKPLPQKVLDLLSWGKPDIIVYDVESDKILIAAEETAAVPTGNQALQRCERIYGASRMKIPTAYLIGEFGTHIDGGQRRDSIWPTLQALKLTLINGIVCVVLHYGDRTLPDDYTVGSGLRSVFRLIALIIEQRFGENVATPMHDLLLEQYEAMLEFINSQWKSISKIMPGHDLFTHGRASAYLFVQRSQGGPLDPTLNRLNDWPLTSEITKGNLISAHAIKFRVADKFLENIHELIEAGKAYTISSNASSKPQDTARISTFINQQRRLYERDTSLKGPNFDLHIEKFPISSESRRHVSTSLRIAYFIDSLSDLIECYRDAFPRAFRLELPDLPLTSRVFLYVCNSMMPSRIFGDPYIGQIAAYNASFTKRVDGTASRLFINYYPHQAHTQLMEKFDSNTKGVQIIKEMVDYAIFHSGVFIDIKHQKRY